MSGFRRFVVSMVGGTWRAVDEHGVIVTIRAERAETIDLVGNAGTDDHPVSVEVQRPDGSIEAVRTFPPPTERPTPMAS